MTGNDVVILVGPNNAGKSATLRAIDRKIADMSAPSPVLKELTIETSGSSKDLLDWLNGWAFKTQDSTQWNTIFRAFGTLIQFPMSTVNWDQSKSGIRGLTRCFCHFLTADERLNICKPAPAFYALKEGPSHPIQNIYRDDTLERKLSDAFRAAFGLDLVVHRSAGKEIPIYVGERPVPLAGEDRVSKGYVERLEKLPLLHEQGDGMRSFAGVLLATSVGNENIILLDEPEAFLHPPQARHLGSTLVRNRPIGRQVIIATHSTDVLRGVLDTGSPDVRVVRIRRNGNVNSVCALDNDKIKELWGDPLLRYSNILDGLFHEGVILCESDSDCRFYAAIMDSIVGEKGATAKRPDLMFTHCGGKQRLPMVLRALKEVDVPVRAVADFDILNSEQPLKDVVGALGTDWTALRPDWLIVKQAIDSKKPDLSATAVKAEINAILDRVKGSTLPSSVVTEIQAELKRTSPWAHVKATGKSFVPSGGPYEACDRLLQALRHGGLHVVHVGELEGFYRRDSNHGPRWVDAVLQRPLGTEPELEEARRFVRDLISQF